MIVRAFDFIATAGFAAAFAVTLHSMVFVRGGASVQARWYRLGAMAVMTFVSLDHILERLGGNTSVDLAEDYVQVLFVPLIVYMMYGLYERSQKLQVLRERAVVDRLGARLSDSMAELDEQRLSVLQALSAAVDARDHYTALHSMHVADYACAIAYRLGMSSALGVCEQAGLLHDIGKIGVSDTLLLKPARLTDEEYEVVKRHSEESARIIGAVPFLSEVVPLVRHHHERWDGSGYPEGLAGEEIPVAARVLAVADAFDAMTTDRPYRAAMDGDEARGHLLEGRGSQFDPAAVDALVELLDEGVISVESRSDVG